MPDTQTLSPHTTAAARAERSISPALIAIRERARDTLRRQFLRDLEDAAVAQERDFLALQRGVRLALPPEVLEVINWETVHESLSVRLTDAPEVWVSLDLPGRWPVQMLFVRSLGQWRWQPVPEGQPIDGGEKGWWRVVFHPDDPEWCGVTVCRELGTALVLAERSGDSEREGMVSP